MTQFSKILSTRVFYLVTCLSLLGFSSEIFAKRILIAPPFRKKIRAEIPYNDPDSNTPIPQIMHGIYLIITLTNISKTPQRVKVTLMKDSQGFAQTYSPYTKEHEHYKDKGWFVSYGGYLGSHPVAGVTLNQESGCSGFSTTSQVSPPGFITLEGYNPAAGTITNSTQNVLVGFYGGRRPCIDGKAGMTNKSFQHKSCDIVTDGLDKCTNINLNFAPQILIEVEEDKGAIVASATFGDFSKLIGAGGFSYAPLNTLSGVADVKSYPYEYDNSMILINAGRPF